MLKLSQKGHPSSHCPNKKKKKKYNYNNKSKSSKESKSIIKNLLKDKKKPKKTFATLQSNIAELKEDEYNLLDSDGELHADSFFLIQYN